MTVHVHPTAPLAPRVLLPGDPGRALAIAQVVLEAPRMFNHHRGLWGYTGTAADGEPLTVQSTGMGGASAAIVTHELCELGAETVIRIGTCGALADGLQLGDLVVAEAALAGDGASRALGAGERVTPDPVATEALADAAGADARRGLVASTDLFYDPDPERPEAYKRAGALVIEMEAAAVLRVAERHGARGACLLAVTDTFGPGGERTRMDDEAIAARGEDLGRVGAATLLALDARAPAEPRGAA
jgi:DeoD family purine-nucleoside phosphorylase